MDEINELWELARRAKEAGTAINYSVGIYQAIGSPSRYDFPHSLTRITGFKEFTPYLTDRIDAATIELDNPKFKVGLESMKISTRQYSKKQVNWIKRKLIPAIEKSAESDAEGGNDVTLILLDATGEFRFSSSMRILTSCDRSESLGGSYTRSCYRSHEQ